MGARDLTLTLKCEPHQTLSLARPSYFHFPHHVALLHSHRSSLLFIPQSPSKPLFVKGFIVQGIWSDLRLLSSPPALIPEVSDNGYRVFKKHHAIVVDKLFRPIFFSHVQTPTQDRNHGSIVRIHCCILSL
jgi:hypothetical protein